MVNAPVRSARIVAGAVLCLLVLCGCSEEPAEVIVEKEMPADGFVDVALQAGVQDRSSRLHGVAPADYDLDGDIDLFLGNTGDPSRIYWNVGAENGEIRFEPGPVLLQDARVYSAAPADYDNDGDPDLFVGVGGIDIPGLDHLFENRNGGFVDVSAAAGVAGPTDEEGGLIPTETGGGAWADYDGDGWLDLYVTRQDGPNRLYRNLGDGRFVDVAPSVGLAGAGAGWVATWIDYDNDGLLDLYVANRSEPNVLYHHEADGSFAQVTTEALSRPVISAGSLVDDFNNDGWLDLFVTGRTYNQERRHASALLVNDGQGGFVDRAERAGILDRNDPSTFGSWLGFQSGDLTNDGYPELLLGAGKPKGGESNHLFVNTGARPLRFEMASHRIDYAAPHDDAPDFPPFPYRTHGAAFVDFDEDGDLDVFVCNGGPGFRDDTREPNRLFRNDDATGNHWIRLHLVGGESNRDGIGARVVVRTEDAEGRIHVRYATVKASSGFGGNNPIDPHIGLGAAVRVVDVSIRWPSGRLQTIEDPGIDLEIEAREPDSGPRGSVLDLISRAEASRED
jgi:hypothetical protein